jgi:hypothetical protein
MSKQPKPNRIWCISISFEILLLFKNLYIIGGRKEVRRCLIYPNAIDAVIAW